MSDYLLKKTDGLSRSRQIGRVVEELESLALDKQWRVGIEQVKAERSDPQNRYLWGCAYKLISDYTGYELADIHEDCLKRHFGTRLKKVPKSWDHPNGMKEVPIRTTTTDENGHRSVLNKIQFSDYVDFVKRYGAEAGVFIPDPDPNYKIYREHDEVNAA